MSISEKNQYDDIIHLPHPVSSTRPQMPRSNRAAQFSPFAALTGYDAAIRETGRLTDQQIELAEEQLVLLDRKLRLLLEKQKEHPEISVVYFVPDGRKAGGSYVTVTGTVKRVNEYKRMMILMDGFQIPLDDIVELESKLFSGMS